NAPPDRSFTALCLCHDASATPVLARASGVRCSEVKKGAKRNDTSSNAHPTPAAPGQRSAQSQGLKGMT
ncbi:hypothetical protein ACVBEH_25500, partial [Roseateles sp. GG27B]